MNPNEAAPELTDAQISELMHHDPLSSDPVGADASTGSAPPATPEPTATPPQTPAAPQGAAPPAQVPAQSQEQPNVADLQRQLAEARGALEVYSRQPQQQQPPAAQPKDEGPKIPNYMFSMPPQIMQALASEDMGVRSQGMSALISAIGQTIHKNVLDVIEERVRQVTESVPRHFQQQQQFERASRTVQEDFYGTYPELNIPQLYPSVVAVAMQVRQSRPDLAAQGWSPAFRDEVARQVASALNIQLKRKANGAPPPNLAPTGGRPGGQQPTGQQKHIEDMFD